MQLRLGKHMHLDIRADICRSVGFLAVAFQHAINKPGYFQRSLICAANNLNGVQ